MANETSIKFIRTFEELRKGDIPIAGGKGANLGELMSIGVPVPPGFVITTSAYEKILRDNHLEESITNELKQGKDGAAIREKFTKAQMPDEIE